MRFWIASTASAFGTAISAVALPVLTVQVLEATPVEVGLVAAAQFVPYAALGLVVGAYVDRWPRARVLVWASVGRGTALGSIPVLWLLGALEIWSLVLLLLVFGSLMVMGFAASQSLLPQLVPRRQLLVANSRLDQADAAAQTAGPALGGGLVALLGAPLAFASDAVSCFVEAVVVARLRVGEELRAPQRRGIRREIAEGLRWTYRHRVLAPMAVSSHVWFVANAAAFTALAIYALRDLRLSPVVYGALFAVAGGATLAGAVVAPWMGRTLGAGRTIVFARAAYPLAWLLVAAAAIAGVTGGAATGALLAAMLLQAIAAGVENANEMTLRQAVTPDAMLGRTNATIRSANRSMAALGALLAGVVTTLLGTGATFLGAAAIFAVAAILAVLSPLRHARHEDGDSSAALMAWGRNGSPRQRRRTRHGEHD